MKVIKPLTLGTLHRAFRHAGRNQLSVSVLGFFTLGQPVGARLLAEAPQWPSLTARLPAGQPLDEVMPKACAEALVLADACAPSGQTRTHLPVRLQVGTGIDKRLMVYGERQWRYSLAPLFTIDPPQPFERMPLDLAHVYGGPGFLPNPQGRGHEGSGLAAFSGLNQGLMPNLEYRDQPLQTLGGARAHAAAGAALGPVPIDRPLRKDHAGTYDARWLQTTYPGLPDDLDWRLYNQAPLDQRIAQGLQGGEHYLLEGMSPTASVVEGQLPRHRVRVFALSQDPTQPLRELTMQMNTVWFLPAEGLGLVVWRGQTEVQDSDALDVRALLAGYEDPDQPPREPAHYAQVLTLRMDRQQAALHAFNESQLAPPAPVEAPAEPSRASAQERLNAIHATLQAQPAPEGVLPEAAPSAPAALLHPPSAAAVAAGDFDLSDLHAQVQALRQDTEQRAQVLRSQAEAHLAELSQTLPPTSGSDAAAAKATVTEAPVASGSDADPAWQQVLQRANGQAQAQQIEALDLTQSCANGAPRGATDWAATAALQNQARLHAPTPQHPQPALSPVLAQRLGQQVLQWLRDGVPLAGRDLAGADLSGASLQGANLNGALLEQVDLRGAQLQGAQLRQTVLTGARLDGADLSRCDLSGANLCGTQASGALLEDARLVDARASHAHWPNVRAMGADLTRLTLDQADCTGACFNNAQLDGTLLSKARLSESQWQGAQFNRCVAWQVQAQGADFSGSQWFRCALSGAQLQGSVWRAARLQRVECGQTDWSDAQLQELHATQCAWPHARLHRARLDGAYLGRCDLGRAELDAAVLDDACLAHSLLLQTRLVRTSARRVDAFRAVLRKTDLSESDLRDASLYGANLTGAVLQGSRTEGLRLSERRVLT